jgi:5-methylthioadenosine/S-adenosylhomocysteine deaminase
VRTLPGVLLPGLVNTHCHTPMLLLRGMGGDLPLLRWLHEVMWPAEGRLTASDVRAGMVAGCVELLRTGTTTSVEMYFFLDAVIDAVLAVGSRVLLTGGIIAAPGWDRLGSWEAMRDAVSRRIDARGLRFGSGDRIELGYGPHAAYTLPAEALRSVAEHARDRDALLHLHLAETVEEDAALRAEHGSVPALLDRLGVLGGRVLAAHGVHLSDDDVVLLAARGAAVSHCPGSNAKLAAGVARVTALRRAGVRVGLGTDGPASGDDLDLWNQARLAGLLARVTSGDAAALTAPELLLMATRDGAAAIGRDDLGALEPGRRADLVHVDLGDPAFVDPADDAQLLSNLVWAGGARLVRDVWVSGEQVLADGEPTRVDRTATTRELRAVAARLHA